MPPERFPIRVGRRSAPLLRVIYGVRADDSWIELGDGPEGTLEVQFGRAHFRTTLANVSGWQIEGPWLWVTAIGVRFSVRHSDVTFGGSPHGGVRIDFVTPVRWAFLRAPASYVPADDLEGLAAALERRGIAGRDVRKVIGAD